MESSSAPDIGEFQINAAPMTDPLIIISSSDAIDSAMVVQKDLEIEPKNTVASQYLHKAMVQSVMILQVKIFQAQADFFKLLGPHLKENTSQNQVIKIDQAYKESKLRIGKDSLINIADNFSIALVSILDAKGRITLRSQLRYLILLMTRARKVF
jgi:hypothetical protein